MSSGNNNTIDLVVALGNPHLSVKELNCLVKSISLDKRPKLHRIRLIATIGHYTLSESDKLRCMKPLKEFGLQFINDTCWCIMLLDPPVFIPVDPNARILTNSGKYGHYGPGLAHRCSIPSQRAR